VICHAPLAFGRFTRRPPDDVSWQDAERTSSSLRFRYGVEELNYSRFQDVFAPHYEELIFADELLEKF